MVDIVKSDSNNFGCRLGNIIDIRHLQTLILVLIFISILIVIIILKFIYYKDHANSRFSY